MEAGLYAFEFQVSAYARQETVEIYVIDTTNADRHTVLKKKTFSIDERHERSGRVLQFEVK